MQMGARRRDERALRARRQEAHVQGRLSFLSAHYYDARRKRRITRYFRFAAGGKTLRE